MKPRRLRAYRVAFEATRCLDVRLRARSKRDAVAKAQKLWSTKGEDAFECFNAYEEAWIAGRD
jgi:hypothetical protein